MSSLTRAKILGHVDKRIGRIDVPEMGGEVCIASLTVAEADKIKTLGDDGVPAVVTLVILGACDQHGKRLFNADDAESLGNLPASALGRVANAVLSHNKLGGGEGEEKNASSETQDGDSASVSP